MCGLTSVYLALAGFFAYTTATVAAFVYLKWWQALIASAVSLALVVVAAQVLIRTVIGRLGAMARTVMEQHARALKGATVDVHSVRAVVPPADLAVPADDLADEDDSAGRETLRWVQVELTIFPDPATTDPTDTWHPDALTLVSATAKPPSLLAARRRRVRPARVDRAGERRADGERGAAYRTAPATVYGRRPGRGESPRATVQHAPVRRHQTAGPRLTACTSWPWKPRATRRRRRYSPPTGGCWRTWSRRRPTLHARFGGVVPEIASRAHLRHLLPVIDAALRRGRRHPRRHRLPGRPQPAGAGRGAAHRGERGEDALSVALGVPLVAVNHVAAHIYACRLAAGRDIFPCVGLVVSGGHTALFRCDTALSLTLLGGTRDDAAGEAFDKVGAVLGLGFPGGPAVERESAAGDPTAHRFPRTFLDTDRLEFSFSGLKTAVLYACHGQNAGRGQPPGPGKKRADLAASFQAAAVDVLVGKCRQAVRQTGLPRLAVGGGVSANQRLRGHLQAMCDAEGVELLIPPLSLCTDNAAMAALAIELYAAGEFAPPDLDAEPNLT